MMSSFEIDVEEIKGTDKIRKKNLISFYNLSEMTH